MFECREQCREVLTKAFFGDKVNHFRFIEPTSAMILGGAMMGSSLLGKSKSKKLKLPPQYYKAMDELLKRGKADVSYPIQGVAPLSELQQTGIDLGRKYVTSTDVTDVDLASDIYKDIAAPGDILKRPEVRGMVSKATEEGNLMLNRLGRGMVMKGSFGSTPGRDILGRGVTAIQERIATALSEYLNAAENRKLGAAAGLERTGLARETTKLKKVGTAMDLGSLTRSIQQAIQSAKFQKAVSDIEMKYVTQPQTLASVMGQSTGVVTGGEPSMFAQASPLIGSLLSAAIMSGANNSGAARLGGNLYPPEYFE